MLSTTAKLILSFLFALWIIAGVILIWMYKYIYISVIWFVSILIFAGFSFYTFYRSNLDNEYTPEDEELEVF